jgi:superfamily II DNA helicase RecQ
MTIRRFIDQGAQAERPGRQARLEAMIRFAEAPGCRRVPLLRYFGEKPPELCGHCDHCLAAADPVARKDGAGAPPHCLSDATEAARKFLSCVERTGEMFGPSHIIDILRGSRSRRVLSRRHELLSSHGTGRELTEQAWRELTQHFIAQDLIEQDLQFGGLRLKPKGRQVLHQGAKVFVATGGLRKPFHEDVREQGSGRGANASAPAPETAARVTPWITVKRRFHEVGEQFAAGRSIDELAALYAVHRGTIVANLARYCAAGGKADPERVLAGSRLNTADRAQVLAAFERLGTERLAPVREALAGQVAYEELHLLRLYLQCGKTPEPSGAPQQTSPRPGQSSPYSRRSAPWRSWPATE